jgi:hypothetical protein
LISFDELKDYMERHTGTVPQIVPTPELVSELADVAEAHFLPIEEAARFLLDRLDEFDPGDDEPEREYHGHVAPAIARLRSALSRPQ